MLRKKSLRVLFFFYMVIANVESTGNVKGAMDNNDTSLTNMYIEINVNNITLRKCCPFGQVRYDPGLQRDESCVLNNATFLPDNGFIIDDVNCSKFTDAYYTLMGQEKPGIHKNGSIIVKGTSITLGPDKYCLDNIMSIDPKTNISSIEILALICYPKEPDNTRCELNCICMFISCFFIILTVAVFALLPKLRNLHGMIVIACLLSFFVGLFLLSTMNILLILGKITRDTCSIFTFIIYYALLAAFFWLNIMCYDIWQTISGKPSSFSHLPLQKNRFVPYSVYAFGMPTIFTIILAVSAFTIPENNNPWLPHMSYQRCFLHGPCKFLYLYVPIIVLCAANLIFFTLTSMKIAQIKNETNIVNNKDKQRFLLYIKLFLLMGINWILEVISSFYDGGYIWQLVDAYNALVGVIFFLIFICKAKTWRILQERFREVMNRRRHQSSHLRSTQTTNTQSKDRSQKQTKF